MSRHEEVLEKVVLNIRNALLLGNKKVLVDGEEVGIGSYIKDQCEEGYNSIALNKNTVSFAQKVGKIFNKLKPENVSPIIISSIKTKSGRERLINGRKKDFRDHFDLKSDNDFYKCFAQYFLYLNESDFLSRRKTMKDGNLPSINFEFYMNSQSFTEIIEGKYSDECFTFDPDQEL